MNQGLYSAYLGMRARQHALDTIANNIANVSTSGFKSDRPTNRSLESFEVQAQRLAEATGESAAVGTSDPNDANDPASAQLNPPQNRGLGVLTGGATNYAQGAIKETGRALDVAIAGEGYLVVQTPRGERYTRSGALTLNADGQLVTQRGDLVIGQQRGPITVPPGEVNVGDDGTISVNGRQIDRLRISTFRDSRAALAKEGDALFVATGAERPAEANSARVVQGALEMSNVNPVSELAAMMQNGREFDSLQRSMTMLMNDLGRKVASEIGKI
ncbi:MAG: flagellar basal-body rod protein FlgF [Pyrinomonadaceae bacterium]